MKPDILEGGRRLDDEGIILPWYTSSCLEWLEKLYLKGKWVFEYGVGDSTDWFRRQGAIVTGVDSDQMWAAKSGVWWAHYKDEYINHIYDRFGFEYPFDIVVIDGNYRDECTERALTALKPGGYLIIDNYHQASADLKEWPLTDKLIEGMEITIYKEPNHIDWATAVITKK